jgi:phage tail sheath gpL-like
MTIDASAVARAVGIGARYKDMRSGAVRSLPQRIAVIAQGSSAVTYSTEKWEATSAGAAATRFGAGSPIHHVLDELLPANGDGVGTIPVTVYPLEDGYDAVAATGTITPSGAVTSAASFRVRASGVLSREIPVAVSEAMTSIVDKMVAAINAIPKMPVIASDGTTNTGLEVKWAGPSGNDVVIEIIGEVPGVTFAISQPAGGLVNPTVDDALAQIGDIWETMVINGNPIADTTALNAFQTFGEGRWNSLVHKPLVVFTGNTEEDVTTATAVSSARPTDRVNAQLVAPGSVNLPCVVAARQVARIARLANENPPHDYGSQRATGLIPGADGEQWDYTARDQAVKAGSSTIKVKDGVINVADVVTFYAPSDEEPPGYRYVVDIVKMQNILYNLALTFDNAEWDGAPLVPDGQPTTNPAAKTPGMIKAELAALADNLAAEAIISDPAATKAALSVLIDSQNPKRANLVLPVKLSGNLNIMDAIVEFGFHFGAAA